MISDRLTDEVSEIADRLTVAAHSWAEPDAMSSREPAVELELLLDAMNELNKRRLRITELEAALKPFADAVYNDNGDVTVVHPGIGDYMRAKRTI